MLKRLRSILQRECGLKPDQPVVVGVSGGPDSLCLLDILHRAGYPIIVAHFNHRLRPEADEDARAVRRLAKRWTLPFVQEAHDVRAYASRHGMGLEEASRKLRYTFLFAQARKHDAQAVAVGHTADDQVETILMHFLRGAGLSGLKGMTYHTILTSFDPEIPLVRPLLDIWREETVLHCASRGLTPRMDSSNVSLDFLRNRIRHVLIPELETYNPRFREVLWRMGKALAGDHEVLSEVVDKAWERCVVAEGEQFIAFDALALSTSSLGLRRNLLRRAIASLRPHTHDADFATIQRAADFVTLPEQTTQIVLTGGLRLLREAGRLYLATWEADLPLEGWPQVQDAETPIPVSVPGTVAISEEWQLQAEYWDLPALAWEQARTSANPFEVWLDAGRVTAPLVIRTRRPGDRFQPFGMDGHSMKLSDFFVNEKLPRRARQHWPLLCMGETIVWVPGYRLAHAFRLTRATRQVMYFALTRREPQER